MLGYAETLGAAVLTLALYWPAGFYAHELGVRLLRSERVNLTLIWRSCVHELPIIEGGLIPVLALLVAWAAGAQRQVTSRPRCGRQPPRSSLSRLSLVGRRGCDRNASCSTRAPAWPRDS